MRHFTSARQAAEPATAMAKPSEGVVRVIVVGAGERGMDCARCHDAPGMEVVALADTDEKARQSAKEAHRDARIYESHEAAFRLEECADAAIVAVPKDVCADVAAEAVRAGLHVLVEGRMEAGDRERIHGLCVAHNVAFMENDLIRNVPIADAIRRSRGHPAHTSTSPRIKSAYAPTGWTTCVIAVMYTAFLAAVIVVLTGVLETGKRLMEEEKHTM